MGRTKNKYKKTPKKHQMLKKYCPLGGLGYAMQRFNKNSKYMTLIHITLAPYLCDVQMLLVALDSIGKVSQRRVHSPHVAQLASLGEPALVLTRQQHTLLMAGQCVGVVTNSCVHVTQTA